MRGSGKLIQIGRLAGGGIWLGAGVPANKTPGQTKLSCARHQVAGPEWTRLPSLN